MDANDKTVTEEEIKKLINYCTTADKPEQLYAGYYVYELTNRKCDLFTYPPLDKNEGFNQMEAYEVAIKGEANAPEVEGIVKKILGIKSNPNDGNFFLKCVRETHSSLFTNRLFNEKGNVVSVYRSVAKELLVDAVEIYKTPYRDNFYVKNKEGNYYYIGDDWEEYLKKLYKKVPFQIKEVIPFTSIKARLEKLSILETLTPNRDYILFEDCLLNIDTGETLEEVDSIPGDKIPFGIMDGEYLKENREVYKKIEHQFQKIGNSDIMKSAVYSLFNKRALPRGAFFNIQKTGSGKSSLIKAFPGVGLMRSFNAIPKGNDENELFKQYYAVIFEEVQDNIMDGAKFNSIIDNTPISLTRKYKEAVDIPTMLKPNIMFNGESMLSFKGKTQGTNNRSFFIPEYTEVMDPDYGEAIDLNPVPYAIEELRMVIKYKLEVGLDTIKENIQKCKKSDSEIIALKESKINILLEYIQEDAKDLNSIDVFCVSERILVEMVKKLQDDKIITVNLFATDSAIKTFIRKIFCNDIKYPDKYYFDRTQTHRVKYLEGKEVNGNKTVTMKLNPRYQLTRKGIGLVTELGYNYTSLICDEYK